MTNPRDEIDAWLDQEIEPLPPPPGTYQRITRSARRRKKRQATMSAGAAVILVAAAVALPRAVGTILRSHSGSSQAAAGQTHPGVIFPAHSASAGSGSTGSAASTSPSAGATPPGPAQTELPAPQPVASGFEPTSVTMVGPTDGWTLGQAPCGSQHCTVMAATDSYGASWTGVKPPQDVPGAVRQVRFLDTMDGWAYGPQLYQTTDGGSTWSPVALGGRQVVDLETAGQRVFVLLGTCAGGPVGYAENCSGFSLYSAAVGAATLTQVPVPAADVVMKPVAGGSAASLVLASGPSGQTASGAGYLLSPSGAILTGPLTGGAWQRAGRIPRACEMGQPQADGQPTGAMLAVGPAAGTPRLVLSCQGAPVAGAAAQAPRIYVSADGKGWQFVGGPQVAMTATAVTTMGEVVVLATNTGLQYSADGGQNWTAANVTDAPQGGFSYAGMTTSQLGVAVPADQSAGEIFTTSDGGQDWTPRPVRG